MSQRHESLNLFPKVVKAHIESTSTTSLQKTQQTLQPSE